MKTCATIIGFLACWLAGPAALADAGHDKGYTFGSPGRDSEASRTVEVLASDDMRFSPGKLDVRLGETVKFLLKNVGKIRHEFALGDRASQRAHVLMMKKMPDMKHGDDPAAVTIEPGEAKTLVWKFDKKPASPIEIACHEPGHYEAGMRINVTWAK
jgi:uncharacterized cupredoxin-like copper-binding protein